MLRTLDAQRHAGVYRFATLAADSTPDGSTMICAMREPEGPSIVVAESDLPPSAEARDYRAAWITLPVHSALAAVGLTAAVAGALADVNISCNIVAGIRHDHLFVPIAEAESAMTALHALQREAIAGA